MSNIMINLKLIKKYKLSPPFYLYNKEVIEKKFLGLKNILPKNFEVFYSVKANPNIYILKIFKKLNSGVEISSAGELSTVLKADFSSNNIIFTSSGKTKEELKYAINKRVYLIVVESLNEIKKIEQIASKRYKQNILIRINPLFSIRPSSSMFPMAGGSQKFGIDEEKIGNTISQLKEFKHINLSGLHLYSASNIFDEELILKNAEHIFKITKQIEKKFKINLPIIDIGGGLAVDYSTVSKFNIKKLNRGFNTLIKKYNLNDKKIILEIGRFLIGEAGQYIVEVIDKKISRGEIFIIVNGGVNHVSRAALSKRNHRVEILGKKQLVQKETVNIVGNLNTPTDFITKTTLPRIEIGDLLSIKNVGAYGFSSGMIFFSSHPLPNEYLFSKNKIEIIRKKINYQ